MWDLSSEPIEATRFLASMGIQRWHYHKKQTENLTTIKRIIQTIRSDFSIGTITFPEETKASHQLRSGYWEPVPPAFSSPSSDISHYYVNYSKILAWKL